MSNIQSQIKDIKIIHIYKILENHKDSINCWCNPELYYKDSVNNNEVWEHREVQ